MRSLVLVLALGCSTMEEPDPLANRPHFPELDELDVTPDPACEASWIAAATGRVVDEQGQGLPEAKAQLCITTPDSEICLGPPEEHPEGWFARVVDEGYRCVTRIGIRSLVPAGGYGTTYCETTLDPEDGLLTFDDPIILYQIDAAEAPPVGDEDESRDVVFADGVKMQITPSVLGTGYEDLSGGRVSLDPPPCFARDVDGLIALYAFAPERTALPGGFALSIPNHEDLPNGSRVELLVLGGLETFLPDDTRIDVAKLEVFGTGTVVGDEIVSDEGSELPYLSWLAYRAL